ncbi:MAG: guanitoxin biosynthesis L-arginine gamma (S) hydroxylase [Tychonema bourrellyi B0820]|uniref:Fatty acid desaturase n=1 Tax=Tychonema bourrellyi FEM_GT703 TaxID=2040638 RepID=A0A2G4F0G0_9CYAN|nr:guanitoxin biosynthesis L-arginine gamma (S) hydroxylase [Tychonema bourrellyi]MDQ2097731.1 guanitoxin biosynthesis L-arginine gamma (S) hydroxylase [Tychonema bourrellyi B0820]PHX55228.1 fatty acid desaturase [Tychonema bourrellyi FEM_GT703]
MKREYQQYKFSLEIKIQLKELTKLDNWHGLLALLQDCTLILASILITSYVTWFFYPIALLVIGSRQRALTTLLHDSAHGVLAKNKLLNSFLGTFGSGYLIFQQMIPYKKSHCYEHHSHLGNPEVDPDFKFYLKEGLYCEQSPKEFLVNHIIKPLLLFKVPQYIFYLINNRLFGKGCNLYETLIMLTYVFTIVSASVWFGFLDELILFWLVPYVTVFQVLGYFIEVSEHYPLVGKNTVDLYMTRNRFSPWYEAFFTSIHGENFHLVHHLMPSLPFWNLAQAHKILLVDPNYFRHNSLTGGIFFPSNGFSSIVSTFIRK